MKNLFIYTTPHPAHDALAQSLHCDRIKSSRNSIAAIPFFGRIFNMFYTNFKIDRIKYDVVLTESISRDLLAGAYYKHMHPHTKLVALLTDPKLFELSTAPYIDKMLTYWSLDKADLLFVGSQMMYDLVPAMYKYKTKLFYPGIENIDDYLNKHANFSENFVFVGRLDNYKGTEKLPGIFQKIRKIKPFAKLNIAGDGPNKKLFEAQTENGIYYLGKTKNSLFMSDAASIYISAAQYEPSGCAIIEAMAQGIVPIISSGVGYKDIVEKISPDLVCNTENKMVCMATKLSIDKKLWQSLSSACRKEAANYSYQNMISDFKSVLFQNNII